MPSWQISSSRAVIPQSSSCSLAALSSLLTVGTAFGFTEFCMFAIWSLAFWYGSTVVADGDCNFTNMFKAISGMLMIAVFILWRVLMDSGRTQHHARACSPSNSSQLSMCRCRFRCNVWRPNGLACSRCYHGML